MNRFLSLYFLLLLFPGLMSVTTAKSQDWEENAQFGVEIGGAIDVTAQVFRPTNNQPFMILTSEKLTSPVLVDLAKKRVFALKASAVEIEEGGFLKTNGIPGGKDVGSYVLQGGSTTFKVQGKSVTMILRQTLVGDVSQEMILAHSPDYRLRMRDYTPKKSAINVLKSYARDTEVVVMFATWCATCKLLVPKVMRVFNEANNSRFKVHYIGIAMGGNEPASALARHGHDYPAVILYQRGKEVDRIIGDPPGALENLLVDILE
ncbi:MAG: thioredoxin family protein [Bacteroidetes bacterium]|nr:thioredoxin family protein [Bacteroidota bacterium]